MKRKHNLKLPNGFGSIIYLGENRRNPYAAYKTIGYNDDGKQIKKYIGYTESYNKAYQLLLEYNNIPYNLDNKNITLGDVFEKVEPKLLEDVHNNKMSLSNYKNMISVYNNYLIKLKDIKVLSLKKKDVQSIIDKSNLKHTGRGYIKNIFQRLIEYSIDELELNIDKNICDLKIGEKEKSTKHFPFKDDEIQKILKLSETNQIAKLIVIYLYTGLRPNELLDIKIENVFLEEEYMIGGSKTEAGRNRIIPIHPSIIETIKYFYDESNKYLITNITNNNKMNYDTYQKGFNSLMGNLKIEHTPYDTRHTFATKCDQVGISNVNIKILMGHSLSNDVTNDVYIHKDLNSLKKDILKLYY